MEADDDHCQVFTEWLQTQIKPNSLLLSLESYNNIVSFLKADDKTVFSGNFKKKWHVKNDRLHITDFISQTSYGRLCMTDSVCTLTTDLYL